MATTSVQNNTPKVLVVDDSKSVREYILEILQKAGYDVLAAPDGESGLRCAQEYRPDVLLLDIIMPGISGLEVLQTLRESKERVAVILLTVKSSLKDVVAGLNAGADDYLIKPFNDEELIARVGVAARNTLGSKELIMALEKKNQDTNKLKMVEAKLLDNLTRSNEELKKANQKILEQQKSVIEEERLKVLLQMAGATAHELNQPLTTLLGHIELMGLGKEDPQKLARHVSAIEESGRRIGEIVKKIQGLRHDEPEPNLGEDAIIDQDQEVRLLYVEDTDVDFEQIRRYLSDNSNVRLFRVLTKMEAMGELKKGGYDLVFLNYQLPDGDAFVFFDEMREEGLEIPVAIITGVGDETVATRLLQAGAYDYLSKHSLTKSALSRCINNSLEKFRLRRELRLATERMSEMATRDALTGLYNRRYFAEVMEREWDRAKRYGNDLSVCMADLDHFKGINDTYGHPAGDLVLAEVARIFTAFLRSSDIVCRYGGEEFAMILPENPPDYALTVCERLRGMVGRREFHCNSSVLKLTISFGIASNNVHPAPTPEGLVEMADKALYHAKEHGRNQVCLYDTLVGEGKIHTLDGRMAGVG